VSRESCWDPQNGLSYIMFLLWEVCAVLELPQIAATISILNRIPIISH